ncbi:MAG: glycosyltransferase [Candidatus Tectomicrobia bacterium]|nr:glycosyltransferase [Candidatus Tectomicrobia bacterium]
MAIHDVAIVGRNNKYGLTRDAEILRLGLASIGIEAALFDIRKRTWMDRLRRRKVADLVVHLERVHPAWLAPASRHILIPNQERFPRRHIHRLQRIDRVYAKTRHAEELFAGLGVYSAHLGFISLDRYDPSVPKDWKRFFHLAGGSTLKGTEDILALWSAHPEWPELVLVQKQDNAPQSVPTNVTLRDGYVADGELKRLQNACGVHLCPSRAEGWGHNIVEALSCGAVVVTTDAPPMNEHVTSDCGFLVPAGHSEPRHLGRKFFVDYQALETVIERLVAESPDTAGPIGKKARERFDVLSRDFDTQIRALFDQVVLPLPSGSSGRNIRQARTPQ